MGPFPSDHKLVSAVLNIKKPPRERKSLSVHKLQCITQESFKTAFNEDAIDLTSPVDTVLHQFNDELHKTLDTIAPLKEIQLSSAKDNFGLTRLLMLGIEWYEKGSGFGINIPNPIPGRPTKWKGTYTTDFSFIRKNSLIASSFIN